MAITVYGVDPSIGEQQWAELAYVQGALNWYEGTATDIVCTPGGASRQIVIPPFTDLVAPGVLIKSTTSVNVNLAADTAANPRIAYVGIDVDWSLASTAAGTGFSVMGTASATPSPPSLVYRTPGVRWRVPLCRVTVPTGGPAVISGGNVEKCVAVPRRAIPYELTAVNTGIILGVQNDEVQRGSISIPDPGWPYAVKVGGAAAFEVNASAGYVAAYGRIDGAALTNGRTAIGGGSAANLTAKTSQPRTGPCTVTLGFQRVGMGTTPATFASDLFTRLTALVLPA